MSEGCPATFQACPDPSNVVGADVCPTVLWAPSIPIPGEHGKSPTCLWASTVLWALSFAIHGECGRNLPHASDINSVVGAYNHLVPDGVGNKT